MAIIRPFQAYRPKIGMENKIAALPYDVYNRAEACAVVKENPESFLAIDRAGLVGDDGPTHHGVFDVGFLRQVPGMKILCPASLAEQQEMLRWAVRQYNGPVAIRYPRGGEAGYSASDWNGLENTVKCHRAGGDVTLLTYGSMLCNVLQAAEILAREGVEATVLRLLEVGDLPRQALLENIRGGTCIVVEETASGSGIRGAVSALLGESCHVTGIDLGGDFVTHGSVKELYKLCGLDAESIAAFTKEVLGR